MFPNNLLYFQLKSNFKKLNIKYHKTYVNLFKYKIFRSDLIFKDPLETVNSIHDVDLIQSNLYSIYNIHNILSILKSNHFKSSSKFIYKIRTCNISLSKSINSKLHSIQSKDPLLFLKKKNTSIPYKSKNSKYQHIHSNTFNKSTVNINNSFKSKKHSVSFKGNMSNTRSIKNISSRNLNNNNLNSKNLYDSSSTKRYYTTNLKNLKFKKNKLLFNDINPINYISLKQLNLFNISIGSIYYLTSKYKDNTSIYLNSISTYMNSHYISFFRKLIIITLFKEINYFWNILFKNISFERFLNRLLRHGLKYKCEKILYNSFKFIKLKYKKNPFRIFFKAFLNVLPCLEPKPLKFGRQIKMIPIHLHTRRRFFLACKWLIHHSKSKLKNKYKFEKRPFFKKLARELLSSYRKKSKSFLELITLHNLSFDARINMHLLRRRRSKQKRRIFISRKRRKTAYYFK